MSSSSSGIWLLLLPWSENKKHSVLTNVGMLLYPTKAGNKEVALSLLPL